MTRSDEQLISDYLSGDLPAFELLYESYARRLPGFIRSLGADDDSAQDTAQKTWMRVLKALDRFNQKETFRSWLFTIAHRLWIDECRTKWNRDRISLNTEVDRPDKGFDPRKQAESKQSTAEIEEALQALKEDLRQVVLLRVEGELTFQQIAEELDCPLGTVLWRMKEARTKLVQALEGQV